MTSVNANRSLTVVALSGGLDSCVTAATAAAEGRRLAFAHAHYGQLTEARERRAFHEIADHYDVAARIEFDFRRFAEFGGSSLTDSSMDVSPADLTNRDVPTSYVPFRNANILAACVAWAEAIGAEAVAIGAVYEDASGYPDCRPEFFDAFRRVVETGTKPETRVAIETPVIGMSKAEIVRKGVELGAPLELTWSCYRNEERACGLCDSCAYRLRGFAEAGVEDPIPYDVRPNYR
ncbi:MAG: 7-cyano-7-deazaguanine synthase QueC [Ignavibacteriales bacterium]|nr:7-cyano-7-deazaguanine synthase QueC [Ignavibacteriales bacterium]